MADLSQLMKIAPLSGAFMTGQQQSSDMATDEVKRQQLAQWVQELQLKNQQSQVMNPLLAAHQGLQNQTLEAGLPEVVAKGRQATAKATLDEQTLPSTVAQVNTKNTTDVSKLQGEDTNRFVQELTSYGSALENIPAPMRTQALTQMLRQSGRDPTNPMVQQWIQAISADPANMPARMKQMATAMGQTAAQANPAYHQAIDAATIAGDKSRDVANIHAKSAERVANINASARAAAAKAKQDAAADILADVKSGKINFEKAATKFHVLGTLAADDDPHKAKYMELAQQFQEADLKKKREGSANKVDPGSVGVATIEPGTPNLGQAGAAQKAAPPPLEGKTATGAKFKITKTP